MNTYTNITEQTNDDKPRLCVCTVTNV